MPIVPIVPSSTDKVKTNTHTNSTLTFLLQAWYQRLQPLRLSRPDSLLSVMPSQNPSFNSVMHKYLIQQHTTSFNHISLRQLIPPYHRSYVEPGKSRDGNNASEHPRYTRQPPRIFGQAEENEWRLHSWPTQLHCQCRIVGQRCLLS